MYLVALISAKGKGWGGKDWRKEGAGREGRKKVGFSLACLQSSQAVEGKMLMRVVEARGMRDAALTISAVAWVLSVGAAVLSSLCFLLWG